VPCAITTCQHACLVAFQSVAVCCLSLYTCDLPVSVVSGCVQDLFFFHDNSRYANAPQCCDKRTLPVVFEICSSIILPVAISARLSVILWVFVIILSSCRQMPRCNSIWSVPFSFQIFTSSEVMNFPCHFMTEDVILASLLQCI